MKLRKPSVFLVFITIALTLLPGIGFANIPGKIDYVALGDSLAAGRTPYKTMDKSYPDYIAARLADEKLLGSFKNYGVSGNTTADILAEITDINNVEMRSNIAEAEVITLDAGANDLMNCLFNDDGTVNTDPDAIENAITSAGYNIFAILSVLRGLNPQAKIYVMGYYNAFASVPEPQQSQMVQVIDGLNLATQKVTEFFGVSFVPTKSAIAKNYDKYLPNPGDIHLSLFGYKTIAKEFWSAIKIGLQD